MMETKACEEAAIAPGGIYAQYGKRIMDFLLSMMALLVLSPVMLVLIALGAVKMKGNPFFVQSRPGKNEKIFKLIKFRTMTCEKDREGNLLPDEQRLTRYGKLLRSTSLDELPELINILKGDMSIVGPRPLLVEYLPYYTQEERKRHSVRPGLTGWAQINGRNSVDWDSRLALDVVYIEKLSVIMDIKIIFMTVKKVFCRENVAENTAETEGNLAQIRKLRQKATEVK